MSLQIIRESTMIFIEDSLITKYTNPWYYLRFVSDVKNLIIDTSQNLELLIVQSLTITIIDLVINRFEIDILYILLFSGDLDLI